MLTFASITRDDRHQSLTLTTPPDANVRYWLNEELGARVHLLRNGRTSVEWELSPRHFARLVPITVAKYGPTEVRSITARLTRKVDTSGNGCTNARCSAARHEYCSCRTCLASHHGGARGVVLTAVSRYARTEWMHQRYTATLDDLKRSAA
jgi:hypothetical protein